MNRFLINYSKIWKKNYVLKGPEIARKNSFYELFLDVFFCQSENFNNLNERYNNV